MIDVLVTRCGVCGSKDLETVLSLGGSPPTCAMTRIGDDSVVEEHHALELLRCRDCTLVQLSTIVDPKVVFPPDYPYSSGNSKALHDDFQDLAAEAGRLSGGLTGTDLVVDIGANDGTLLSKFDCRTVGVEPTGQARKIPGPAYQAFFDEQLAAKILEEHGPAKVITACNVMAHVENVDTVMRGIDRLLAPGGLFIAENHDLASLVDGRQWDTVYHEHLRYYSPHSFDALLSLHGYRPIAWYPVNTHGGSFRMIAERGPNYGEIHDRDYDFAGLRQDAERARAAIREVTTAGGVWGIGATARATTIINYCGLDVDQIECVCEVTGSDKIGHYIPGTRIPVIDEALLLEQQPDRALLLSWHLADVIVPKLRQAGYHGEIIVPLPTLQTA
jgi:hypothetical protein